MTGTLANYSNMNIASTPVSVNTGKTNFPVKNVVVNPPQNFYTFTVRDAAHLDSDLSRNFMNMLIKPMDKLPKQKNARSKQNWLLGAAIVGGALALWCKKASIVPYVTKAVDWLKVKIPYLQGKI